MFQKSPYVVTKKRIDINVHPFASSDLATSLCSVQALERSEGTRLNQRKNVKTSYVRFTQPQPGASLVFGLPTASFSPLFLIQHDD
jgi:hypothetical protein